MSAMTFKVPEENISRLHAVMDRINKRVLKLGFPPIKVQVGEGVRTEVKYRDEHNVEQKMLTKVHEVTVEGEQPRLAGWKFIGKLEHLPGTEDNLVLGDVPERYHRCPPNCDHCQKTRNRSDTFILQEEESGQFQQIGRSCLKDFFNSDDPMRHAAMLQMIFDAREQLGEMEDYEGGRPSSATYRDAIDVLTIACTFVRVDGYISAAYGEEHHIVPTGYLVRAVFTSKEKHPEIIPEDKAKAAAILEWLTSEETRAKRSESGYFHNLCALADSGMINKKHIGLFASAVVGYDRHLADALLKVDERASEYVGKVDERFGPAEVTIAAKILIPGGMYPDKMLYVMRDSDGNRLSWFNSGNEIGAVGDVLHISGTVKDHNVYRDAKQTTLLRVTALENKLFEAVEAQKDVKVIAKLLKDDINLDHFYQRGPSCGMTPLMLACRNGDAGVAELLLKHHASPDLWDRYGNVPAHFAAVHGYTDCLNVLREWGADMTIESTRKETVEAFLKDAQDKLLEVAIKVQDACPVHEGRGDATKAEWSANPVFALNEIPGTKNIRRSSISSL